MLTGWQGVALRSRGYQHRLETQREDRTGPRTDRDGWEGVRRSAGVRVACLPNVQGGRRAMLSIRISASCLDLEMGLGTAEFLRDFRPHTLCLGNKAPPYICVQDRLQHSVVLQWLDMTLIIYPTAEAVCHNSHRGFSV